MKSRVGKSDIINKKNKTVFFFLFLISKQNKE